MIPTHLPAGFIGSTKWSPMRSGSNARLESRATIASRFPVAFALLDRRVESIHVDVNDGTRAGHRVYRTRAPSRRQPRQTRRADAYLDDTHVGPSYVCVGAGPKRVAPRPR